MDEYIIPVCSPEYAEKFTLMNTVENLQHCTLLHDCQAWSNGMGTDEWNSWAAHFNVDLDTSLGMSFDRSDLALIAAKNNLGITMGRKRLVQKDIENGELVMPFQEMYLRCDQHYYIASLKDRQWPKIDAFIEWLTVQSKDSE